MEPGSFQCSGQKVVGQDWHTRGPVQVSGSTSLSCWWQSCGTNCPEFVVSLLGELQKSPGGCPGQSALAVFAWVGWVGRGEVAGPHERCWFIYSFILFVAQEVPIMVCIRDNPILCVPCLIPSLSLPAAATCPGPALWEQGSSRGASGVSGTHGAGAQHYAWTASAHPMPGSMTGE